MSKIWLVLALLLTTDGVASRLLCPENKCPLDSVTCPYPSYFGNALVGTCRGCNYCVKPGTPVDSVGCPMLPCPRPSPDTDCKNPMFFSRWIYYMGQRCQACHVFLCDPKIVPMN